MLRSAVHGVILSELQKYVDARHGSAAWPSLLRDAGLGTKLFSPFQTYPDAEVMAIVAAASRVTGKPVGIILEDFGEFMAPDLLALYRALIKPEWRTLDLLEHTEVTIHRVVRARSPEAKPPELKVARIRENEVVINYASPRKLCAVAKGIVRGIARHFGERISLIDIACMQRGAPQCTVSVRTLPVGV
jgi:predicted hydrocarbon binding protein